MLYALLFISVALADRCLDYAASAEVASIGGTAIVESSGLAFSRTRPGVWFTHNDSGGDGEIYSFDLDGDYVETHPVTGIEFRDWEDLSAGPCPGDPTGACLFIGDIGDNPHNRAYVTVYAVREPAVGGSADLVATWHVVYPMSPEDSESLFVHPRTGRVYLVTKSYDDVSYVYRLPEVPTSDPDAPGAVEYVATLDFGAFGASIVATTGADWEQSGDRVAIRTYSTVFEWDTDPCDPDAHWGRPPDRSLPNADTQGEAVAYSPSGDLITTSEGDPMVVRFYDCLAPGPASAPCPGDETGAPDTGTPPDTDDPGDTGPEHPGETGSPDSSSDTAPPDPDTSDTPDDTSSPGLTGGFRGGCDPGGPIRSAWLLGLAGVLLLRRRIEPEP